MPQSAPGIGHAIVPQPVAVLVVVSAALLGIGGESARNLPAIQKARNRPAWAGIPLN